MFGCLHYFCKPCVAQYSEDLIGRGDVSKLHCPNSTHCKTLLTEVNLRAAGLSEDMVNKVTVFSLNQAIEGMEDFSWCPITECGAPAELDHVKNFGRCG